MLVQEYKIKILKYMDEVGKLDNCDRKRLYKVIKNCTKCVLKKSFYDIMERKKRVSVMTRCYEISDYEWKHIKELFPKENIGTLKRLLKDNRIMLNAMALLIRSQHSME